MKETVFPRFLASGFHPYFYFAFPFPARSVSANR